MFNLVHIIKFVVIQSAVSFSCIHPFKSRYSSEQFVSKYPQPLFFSWMRVLFSNSYKTRGKAEQQQISKCILSLILPHISQCPWWLLIFWHTYRTFFAYFSCHISPIFHHLSSCILMFSFWIHLQNVIGSYCKSILIQTVVKWIGSRNSGWKWGGWG